MSNKRKSLEEWKKELIGKLFGKLTVIDVQQHYKKCDNKKSGFEAVCKCVCGNKKIVTLDMLFSSKNISCGCFKKEIVRENIKKALLWQREHPEETLIFKRKSLEKAKLWRAEHPEESKNLSLYAVKKAQEKVENNRSKDPEKYKQIVLKNLEKAQLWRKEHSKEAREISQINIKKAYTWQKEHPEENKSRINNLIEKNRIWRKEHPDIVRSLALHGLKKANLWRIKNPTLYIKCIQRSLKTKISKEEKELYNFLCTLGYNVERQKLVENHYFDFKINNFLIEYNGSIYHYTDYENINNPKAKKPPSTIKSKNYHLKLRELALKHNYHLIQVWDFDWKNRKEFIKTLFQEQLSETANYKDYIESGLLNNDYGFIIDGEQIEPKPVWVATGYKNIVNEDYTKGKVLVNNSGFTKIKHMQ